MCRFPNHCVTFSRITAFLQIINHMGPFHLTLVRASRIRFVHALPAILQNDASGGIDMYSYYGNYRVLFVLILWMEGIPVHFCSAFAVPIALAAQNIHVNSSMASPAYCKFPAVEHAVNAQYSPCSGRYGNLGRSAGLGCAESLAAPCQRPGVERRVQTVRRMVDGAKNWGGTAGMRKMEGRR
jgi:hypothetical protein